MIRVLHLRTDPTDEQARRLSSLLSREAKPPFELTVRTIGRGGTYRSVLQAALALRRRRHAFDLVHAWDPESFRAAQWAGGRVILASLSTVGSSPLKRLAGREIQYVYSTPSQCAIAAVSAGKAAVHLIDPAVEAAAPSLSRQTMRSTLGLTADDRVIIAPGESTRTSGHAMAVWVVSMLHIIDPRYKLLIEGVGPYAPAARKMAAALNRPGLLRVAADAGIVGSVTPAADAALFTPTGDSPVLPLVQAIAAGLPVVATDHPAFRGFLIEGNGVLFGESKRPPSVARRVIEMFERPGLRETLAATARREAARRFGVKEFLQRYWELYHSLAEQKRPASRFGSSTRNATAAFA